MKKQNKILISAGAFWYSCNESTKKKIVSCPHFICWEQNSFQSDELALFTLFWMPIFARQCSHSWLRTNLLVSVLSIWTSNHLFYVWMWVFQLDFMFSTFIHHCHIQWQEAKKFSRWKVSWCVFCLFRVLISESLEIQDLYLSGSSP